MRNHFGKLYYTGCSQNVACVTTLENYIIPGVAKTWLAYVTGATR